MQERVGFFSKVTRFLDTVRAENLILGIYTLVSFLLIFVHEPWRDEAQYWLLARDASIPEILGNISKEGIPPLWQLLLKPFAMLGLPYYPTISIISFVLVAAAAWIFVKKAPFPRIAKYILLISPVFIYCYATVSRSYSLMPLAFVLLAILYPKRLQRPILYGLLIALLFEVHVILWGMVAALAVEYLIALILAYKKDRNIKQAARSLSAALPLLVVALHYLLWFSAGAKASVAVSEFSLQMGLSELLHELFLGIGSVFGNTLAGREFVGVYLMLMLLAFSAISIHRDRRWWKYALIAGCSILFECFIAGFVYADGNFRSISIFLILAFVIWLAKNDAVSSEIRFLHTRTSWVAFVCVYTFFGMLTVAPQVLEDVRYPFSDSKSAAAYIELNIPSDALIMTSSDAQMSAISAYLKDYTFYDTEKQKAFSYFTWDDNPDWDSIYGEMIDGEKQLTIDRRLYLITQEALARSNGTEDGFYYIFVPAYSKSAFYTMEQNYTIYETRDAGKNRDRYQILFIPFADLAKFTDPAKTQE